MADSSNLELSLKIQADLKSAKNELKEFEDVLASVSDQNAARVAKEIADSDALVAAQVDASNRYHKQNKAKQESDDEAAEAAEKHKKEIEKLASGLNSLLEAIDPTLKGMSRLDEMEEKLAASFKAGVLDEQTYADNLKKIMAQREALNKVSEGAAGFKAVEKNAKQAGSAIEETKNKTSVLAEQFNRFKNTAIALTGITFGAGLIRGLGQTADEYSNLEARIKLVSTSNEQARLSFQSVIRLSNETSQSIASTAELYTRLSRAMKDTASQSELLQVTSTVNKAAVVSGATTQEASAAIIQLSQGLASGVLRGEEFNSVAEQMPRIMTMLQKSLNKTQGELRKMAAEGLLTTSVVFKALKDGAVEVDAEFAQMPLTISRATAQLSNGWMEFVGGTNDALGVTKLFASVISGLAGNMSTLATAAVALAVVITGRKVAAFLTATQAARAERLETLLLAEAEYAQSKAAVAAAQAELARANASGKINYTQRIQAEQAITNALNQQAAAEKNLALAKVGNKGVQGGLLGRMGGGLMGLMGGPMGLAITGVTLAVGGLTSAYAAAQAQEQALEQQHRQTIQTLSDQTQKTYALVDAQGKLRENVSTTDVLSQQKSNAETLTQDAKALEDLSRRAATLRARLDDLMQRPFDNGIAISMIGSELETLDKRIEELSPRFGQLNDAQAKLSEELDSRLARILTVVDDKGKTLQQTLESLFEMGPVQGTNFGASIEDAAIKAEQRFVELNAQTDKLKTKLEKDFKNATMTAAAQLEELRDKIIAAAIAAGRAPEDIDKLRESLEKLVKLQKDTDQAKENKRASKSAASQAASAAKAAENYVKNLEKQAENLGKTKSQLRAYEIAEKGLTGTLKKRAEVANALIALDEKRQQTYRNAQLQAQLLQATGHEQEAALLSLRTQMAEMREEFTKTENTEGLVWLDKLLPAQEAKIRADELKTQIDRIQQLRDQKESRIQTQMDAGLISEVNGRRQILELHKQTGEELQKYLPAMQEIAQQPGQMGQQMQSMLVELENELLVLKNTTDELTSAFKDGFQDGVENTLNGLANGTLALSDAVLNLGKSIVSSMAQVASRNLASMAMEGMGSLFSSGAETATKTASDTAGASMYATSITTSSTAGATMYATAFTAGTTALVTALTASFAAGATTLATAIAAASSASGASGAFSAGLKGLGMGFADGGHVTGPGTKTSDSIMARLSNGEFVMKAAAVDKWGVSFLHAINQGVLPGFADGGLVSAPRFNTPKLPSSSALPDAQGSGPSPVNLQQKLIIDPNEVLSSAMSSVAGERTFMTFVTSHKETLRQALGVD